MLRSTVASALLATFGWASAAEPVITVDDLPAPAAAAGSGGPSLARGPDGMVWLTWLETQDRQTALRMATLAPGSPGWSAPRTVAAGENWFVNWADFPALTAGPGGRATAVWFVTNPAPPAPATAGHDHHGPGYRAFLSTTTDAGRSWSEAAPLTTESSSVEFVSLATLEDGRVLAAWLDGRDRLRGGRAQQLFARVIGVTGPDQLVDPAVCDCCQTSLTAFPDGSALLAYRGRTAEEVRDIRLARFHGGGWEPSRALHHDGWRLTACPVNGPQLTSDGGRLAAAWFTAAGDDPRVLVSYSGDAGARLVAPLRLSEGRPAGRVAITLLRNDALLVTWVDAAGVAWLRRVSPDFVPTEPVRLSAPAHGRVRGFPRLALLRDYAGGLEPAVLLAAYATDAGPALRTRRVTIPEGQLVQAEQNCDCAPAPELLRGYPIRGVILGPPGDADRLRVRHFAVPGFFAAGTREFRLAPEARAGATGAVGSHFLGRFERREGGWTLIAVRLIAAPPR
jgi:hypothetical protein